MILLGLAPTCRVAMVAIAFLAGGCATFDAEQARTLDAAPLCAIAYGSPDTDRRAVALGEVKRRAIDDAACRRDAAEAVRRPSGSGGGFIMRGSRTGT